MKKPRLFHRLFVANRGEVAARIGRTCDSLGITPVFGVSEADREAPYARGRERVVLGPPRADQSYLDMERVVQAAVQTGCTALHPGWGFLAENPRFAALAEAHGVTFVGPPAHVMALVGKKTPAKRAMAEAGLAVIPGSEGVLSGPDEAASVAERVGYPVLLKAESGGGGRGMRVVEHPSRLREAYEEASAEAEAAFGDPRLYLERRIDGGRHIEVQLLGDRYGHVIHLGERDCSIQRAHQKLLEESPALVVGQAELARTLETAARAAARIGYVSAGTLELLLDEAGTLRFMEVNARLQVEHSVTEMRAGVDLVAEQIRIAAGARLAIAQSDVRLTGHAIECRINAEDPARGFAPSPGTLRVWDTPPESAWLRIDTHVEAGYAVPPFYDSLLCKVITRGERREEATERMITALEAIRCEGVPTTIPMHLAVLRSEDFRRNDYDTRRIPGLEAV